MTKILIRSANKVEEFEREVKPTETYLDIAKEYEDQFLGRVMLAKRHNHLYELSEKVKETDHTIELLDTTDTDGNRVYMRTLSFIFIIAIDKVFNDESVVVEHTISNGLYCTVRCGDKIVQLDSHTKNKIKDVMTEIIEQNLKIESQVVSLDSAINIFEALGRDDKVALLKYRQRENVTLYKISDYVDHFYGHMAPYTGFVKTFDLELFDHGIVLVGQDPANKNLVRNFIPNYKLSDAYNEAESWSEMQGITDVPKLNEIIESGKIGDVCRMSEALQQHKIMDIAEKIRKNNKRIILIAAPSSSGKTSFAYKLTTSLRVLGLRPIAISLDDYFVNREDTPLDEEGNYDFESIEAIDIALFNRDLNKLMLGEEVEKIRFDFIDGKRIFTGENMSLSGSDPVIIEGIHGLNPILTRHIDDSYKFKIYLSVITQINLDGHNRIPTTDLRLLRRMARDKHFRGKDVSKTILEWPRVRAGERRNIFPYQEEADVMFNSSFTFDISAIKPIVIDDIESITDGDEAYVEAARLKSFLQYFVPIEDNQDIVNTSILREFIGGSRIV